MQKHSIRGNPTTSEFVVRLADSNELHFSRYSYPERLFGAVSVKCLAQGHQQVFTKVGSGCEPATFWFHGHSRLQHHYQVCWQHDCGRSDHQCRWDSLQRGGQRLDWHDDSLLSPVHLAVLLLQFQLFCLIIIRPCWSFMNILAMFCYNLHPAQPEEDWPSHICSL